MKKKYPTTEELQKLWWFRLGITIKWIITILAVFSPSFINVNSKWFFDGFINAIIWYITLTILGSILKYIIYGKMPKDDVYRKEHSKKMSNLAYLIVFSSVYLLIVWVILSM